MYGYIYETTNKLNNKKYIGKKTSSLFVDNYFGSGILISKALKKYGIENFSVRIIQECNNNDELNNAEKYWIKYYNAYKSDNYYNIAIGGEGGNTYAGKTESELLEISKKISIKNSGDHNGNKGQFKGKLNGMYGKKQSYKTRQQISESLKKLKRNTSHPWTSESNDKRNETFENYCYLWEIENINTHEIVKNYTHSSVFIKSIYPDAYNKLELFDKRTLKRDGIIQIDNIKIKISLIDIKHTDKELLQIYNQYHKDWKLFIYKRRKQNLKLTKV